MAVLKVLSTDTVLQAFINKYNPTVDEIIVDINRSNNLITYTKEGGASLQAVLLQSPDSKISGLAVTNGANNLNFNVSAGSYIINDEQFSYAGGAFTLSDGDAVNDRVDLVVLDDAGLLVIVPGTPSAPPLSAPTIASNQLFLCSFIVKAGATISSNNDVFINTSPPAPTDGPYIPSEQLGDIIEAEMGIDSLPELTDVTIDTPLDNQLLKYSGGKWINEQGLLSQLFDINLTGLANNFILKYDSGSGKWIVKDLTVSSLNDTNITAPQNGQFLQFNGAEWVNGSSLAAATINGQVRLNGFITPPTLSASQNNYNPTGLSTANVLRLSSSSGINITGITKQPQGAVLVVLNVGTFAITLKNNSASSLSDNRFLFKNDTTIQANESTTIIYDDITKKWREINRI